MKKYISGIFLLFLSYASHSQSLDSLINYEVGVSGILGTDEDAMPHWLIFNRNGIYEGNVNELLLSGKVKGSYSFGKYGKIEAGVTGIGKSNASNSYLHEAYLNIAYGPLKLIAGKQEINFAQYSDALSSGSFFQSNNARPIPRVGIGFYEYTDVPLTNGFVQVKGFINQGLLNDERGERGTKKPLFHEKSAYLRTNKLPIKFHIGMNHSALFGGTNPNRGKLPADFIATFFGKGSDKVGDISSGEATNAAGGHFGLFDMGLNVNVSGLEVQTYMQKPFSDKSGMTQFFERNRDFIFGLVIKSETPGLVDEFIYESISTVWQSGPGALDPRINGTTYLPHLTDNYDEIMLKEYGIDTTVTADEFWRYVKRVENYGYDYHGRDTYYTNGLYQTGWSYNGKALGNSLLLTADRVLAINPDFDARYDHYFVNTRIRGHHFGIKGNFSENLDYRLIFTFVKNFGTYIGLNKGFYSWESKDPDSDYMYYFEGDRDGLNEKYLLFETNYSFPNTPGLSLNLNLGVDYGEMYSSFGAVVGLKYQGVLND